MLYIYNTMTGKKEAFKQISPDGVRMYVCGVTVYDYCHIGHARSAVAFDTIRRGLEWNGMPVIFVKNYTDIDDKIINKANETGKYWKDISSEFITAHDEDMGKLGVLPPVHAPKATEYIEQMVAFCSRLVDSGHAYASGGDVYFRVKSFDEYGKLSGKNIDDLMAGARVDVNSKKENPLDFVLWKGVKPGEPSWDSPWGQGRPGWHIECSVMSETILGVPIDIHGGGQDLIFPHHENEIAQSECACGCELSRFWVHNGFVNVNHEKMSKSLGNFFTIRDILKDVEPEVLRFFLLTTHYRQPLDYADTKIYEAEASLHRIYIFKDELENAVPSNKGSNMKDDIIHMKDDFDMKFQAAINDDFNTPSAIAALFDAVRAGNKVLMAKPNGEGLENLKKVAGLIFADISTVLYIGYKTPAEWYAANLTIPVEQLENKIEQRNIARQNKDFAASDMIRDELALIGIELIDTSNATRFRTRRVRNK